MKRRVRTLNEINSFQDNSFSEHDELANLCLSTYTQLHLLHWQTKIQSIHEALGDAYEDFQEEMDELIEMIQADKDITIKFVGSLDIKDISEIDMKNWISERIVQFESFKRNYEKNSAIQQELTELVEILTKLKFQLSLK